MAWSCISVVLLGWAWLGVLASGHSVRQDVVSDPRAIAARHPFALLQTGARQSFCQVMILSENSGVAAASCFDYVGHQVDMRMDYSVVVGGAGTEITAQALVQSVIVHPDYDPETFLNNIAVLKFDSVNLANLYPNVGANTQEWNRLVFVHRTLFEDSSQWNDYNVYTDGQESQMCVNVEPFRQSYKDWACGGIIANSPYGDSCDVPYKMIIGQTENESAMLGFYSHSELVPGDMFCKPNGVHWFVMVANYIPWINNQGLEQGVSAITLTPGAQIATDVAYKVSMSPPTTPPAGTSFSRYSIRNYNQQFSAVPWGADPPSTTSSTIDSSEPSTSTRTVTTTEVETVEGQLITDTMTMQATQTETEEATVVITSTLMTTGVDMVTVTETETEMITSTMTTTMTDTATVELTQYTSVLEQQIQTLVSNSMCPTYPPCTDAASTRLLTDTVSITNPDITETETTTATVSYQQPEGTASAGAWLYTITATVSEPASTSTETITTTTTTTTTAQARLVSPSQAPIESYTVTAVHTASAISVAVGQPMHTTTTVSLTQALESSQPNTESSTIMMAALVALLVTVLLVAGCVVCLCIKRRRQKQLIRHNLYMAHPR